MRVVLCAVVVEALALMVVLSPCTAFQLLQPAVVGPLSRPTTTTTSLMAKNRREPKEKKKSFWDSLFGSNVPEPFELERNNNDGNDYRDNRSSNSRNNNNNNNNRNRASRSNNNNNRNNNRNSRANRNNNSNNNRGNIGRLVEEPAVNSRQQQGLSRSSADRGPLLQRRPSSYTSRFPERNEQSSRLLRRSRDYNRRSSSSSSNSNSLDRSGIPSLPTPTIPDELTRPKSIEEEDYPSSYNNNNNRFDGSSPVFRVQGKSLKTWRFATSLIDRIHVMMKTDGRPLHSKVSLWEGPDNCPQELDIYVENGALCPFNAILETPGRDNTISIQNDGAMEFPIAACIEAETRDDINNGNVAGLQDATETLRYDVAPRNVQGGGAVWTKAFRPEVQSVQILIENEEGRPISCRVELLQGPNNHKQTMQVYSDDGYARPLYIVLETPDEGNVVRIVNTAPLEYPLLARVESYLEVDALDEAASKEAFFYVD